MPIHGAFNYCVVGGIPVFTAAALTIALTVFCILVKIMIFTGQLKAQAAVIVHIKPGLCHGTL